MTTDNSSSRFNFRNENYTDGDTYSSPSPPIPAEFIPSHPFLHETACRSSCKTTFIISRHDKVLRCRSAMRQVRMSLPGIGIVSVVTAPESLVAAWRPSDVCCSLGSFSNELNNDMSEVELDMFRARSSSVQRADTHNSWKVLSDSANR